MRNRLALLTTVLVLAPAAGAAAQDAESAAGGPRVVIETSKGDIVLELDSEKAPKTVENFLAYVRDGHYDGTIVYRVTSFLIQAGSTEPSFHRRPTRDPIANEADNGLKNVRGAVGMARWQPHSATAEFYVNTKANPHLDHRDKTDDGWGYCVFGRVVEGMETVDAIAAVATGVRNTWRDVPLEDVRIERVYVSGDDDAAAETSG